MEIHSHRFHALTVGFTVNVDGDNRYWLNYFQSKEYLQHLSTFAADYMFQIRRLRIPPASRGFLEVEMTSHSPFACRSNTLPGTARPRLHSGL